MTERHGEIVRDAGSCVLVTDLETHRAAWKRAVRIILKVQILVVILLLMIMLKSSNSLWHQKDTLATVSAVS